MLIGIAVLIGVFLLQQVDSDATSSAKSPATTSKPKTTTTKACFHDDAEGDDHGPATPVKTPAEMKIVVLNAGTVTGGAKTLQTKLTTAGYANEQDAGDWPGPDQTGKSVLCKPGLDRERSR